MSSLSRLVELFNRANEAKLATGVGYLRQLREFYPLTRAPNFLGPSEYFDYRLYEPSLTSAAKRQFVGYRSERIYSRLNTSSWHGAANDKVLFEQVMIAAGFKTPKTLAIYQPWRVAGEYREHVSPREDPMRLLLQLLMLVTLVACYKLAHVMAVVVVENYGMLGIALVIVCRAAVIMEQRPLRNALDQGLSLCGGDYKQCG